MIPMVDLKAQYAGIQEEVEAAVLEVLRSGWYVMGPQHNALEEEAATYLGVKHGLGVASGTDALHLALRAAGIEPGDEVITTAFTFVGTVEAILYIGAIPIYADIDPVTFNIDPAAVEAVVTPRTKAILPVHLFGLPADMDAIMEIADRHGLAVIEDAAQSIGARWRDTMTGGIGLAGCFSFYPTKNLSAAGDGGLITTNSDEVAA
ncbi:MAG: erythromycin biosynthesis sensory transduction protein eryC1, partial [Gemmatimonas sp. SG8_23]